MQKAYSADNNSVKDTILKEDNVEIDFETGEVIEDVEYTDPVQENFEDTPFEEA